MRDLALPYITHVAAKFSNDFVQRMPLIVMIIASFTFRGDIIKEKFFNFGTMGPSLMPPLYMPVPHASICNHV